MKLNLNKNQVNKNIVSSIKSSSKTMKRLPENKKEIGSQIQKKKKPLKTLKKHKGTKTESKLDAKNSDMFDVPEFQDSSGSDESGLPLPISLETPKSLPFNNEIIEDETSIENLMTHFDDGIWYQILTSNSILIFINPSTSLAFSGKCKIKVLKGSVEVCGHTLGKDSLPQEVYSPSHLLPNLYCIQVIETTLKNSQDDDDSSFKPYEQLIESNLLNLLKSSTNGAVLIMEGFETDWSLSLRSILQDDAKQIIGDEMAEYNEDDNFDNFFVEKLGFVLKPASKQQISQLAATSDILSTWTNLLQEILSSNGGNDFPKIGIFGGKNSGKSTLARWLSNKLLTYHKYILYIDLDPGQPELTPAGMISIVKCNQPLLGPNYTHLTQPIWSKFLGSTNMADTPLSYYDGFQQLFNFINDSDDSVSLKNMPWIVNTMGFPHGLGLDLNCEIIKTFGLHSVIQLNLNREKQDISFKLTPHFVSNHKNNLIKDLQMSGKTEDEIPSSRGRKLFYRHFHINSLYFMEDEETREGQSSKTATICRQYNSTNSKHERDVVMISYFAHIINSRSDLESVVPYIVPLDSVIIGVEGLDLDISSEAILRTLNGNLVALCHSDSPSSNIESSPTKQKTPRTLNMRTSTTERCFGYGIVRAVDWKQQLLFIITPVLSTMLENNVNCIIPAGKIGIPLKLHRNQQLSGTPYVMNSHEHRVNSRLHTVTKKFYVPNRVATHNLLRKCLL